MVMNIEAAYIWETAVAPATCNLGLFVQVDMIMVLDWAGGDFSTFFHIYRLP